jgi:hypothetical protein
MGRDYRRGPRRAFPRRSFPWDGLFAGLLDSMGPEDLRRAKRLASSNSSKDSPWEMARLRGTSGASALLKFTSMSGMTRRGMTPLVDRPEILTTHSCSDFGSRTCLNSGAWSPTSGSEDSIAARTDIGRRSPCPSASLLSISPPALGTPGWAPVNLRTSASGSSVGQQGSSHQETPLKDLKGSPMGAYLLALFPGPRF